MVPIHRETFTTQISKTIMSEIRPRIPSELEGDMEDILIQEYGYKEGIIHKSDFQTKLELLIKESSTK